MADVFEKAWSRLKSQYKDDDNILYLVETISEMLQGTEDAIEYMLGQLSQDDSEGAQKDFLGERIGIKRPLLEEIPGNLLKLFQLGEADDSDGRQLLLDESDPDALVGGYLVGKDGTASKSQPGEYVDDDYYDELIDLRKISYRQTMTRKRLFEYLLQFGGRSQIDDDTMREVEIDLFHFYDLTDWEKHHLLTKGFNPVVRRIKFKQPTEDIEAF